MHRDVTQLDKIQDYRFGSMVKSERYAFARGLTINPTHLPDALDAMEQDGWSLLAIFGDVDASKIGFIFRRSDQTGSHNEAQMAAEIDRLRKRVDELLNANNVNVELRREEAERRRVAERRWQEFQDGTPLDQIE